MILRKNVFLKNRIAYSVLIISVLIGSVFGFVLCRNDSSQMRASVSRESGIENLTVIVDAGHGGEDGGAVGVSGTLEKDINLSVSKKLSELFRITDINVVMTRNDDRMLYSESQSSRKKFYDVRNRALFAESFEKPIFISIHQNKFPISKYRGLQVYYSSNNDDSMKIAQLIQTAAQQYLQKDNNRKIKESGASIYLMKNLKCPALLVECGFMSNANEEALLNDEEYQRKIAFIIFSSVMDYLSENQDKSKVLQ